MPSRWMFLWCIPLLAVCAFVAGDFAAGKGKPVKPPKPGGDDPTGTIYFKLSGRMHTMSPDGSDKTALSTNVGGEPSRSSHGGHRWFLQVRDTTAGKQLFAVRDDGNESSTVQLTTNSNLEVHPGNPQAPPARWGVDDAEVTWIGRRSVSGVVVEGGIYAADIAFDGDGNVTGLDAQPQSPLVEGSLLTVNSQTGPDIRSHDWSPDGDEIVYDTRLSNGGVAKQITVVDLVTETDAVHTTSRPAMTPVWSPDGSTIVFGGGHIVKIKPDGTGEKTILRPRGKVEGYSGPRWSPTGSHLICTGFGMALDDDRTDVYRITSGGGDRTNLTSELDTRFLSGTPAGVAGWR